MTKALQLALALAGVAAAQKTPPNATTVKVVALRPAYLPGISDKDTADVAGDIFFWLKDRILHPMHCRRDPSWGQCNSAPLLYEDNVYTWSEVAATLPWGHYASCNPVPSDPSGKTWSCNGHGGGHGGPNLNMGRAQISRFAHGQFPGDIYAPAMAQLLGNETSGFWYSNLHEGDCDNPQATACRWKLVKTVVSKNATCVNNMIVKAVLARPNPCWANCTASEMHNQTSDCWIDCFLRTIMGMTTDEVTAPFSTAFDSEDPAKGGCPTVPEPPAPPPAL